MRRIRIAIIGESPCNQCRAACCHQNGHDFAVLLQGDEVRKFAVFSRSAMIENDGQLISERVIPYVDGKCPFLGEDNLCTIYDDRPSACRIFQCTSRFNRHGVGKHDRFLELNPRVREMLERW
jgi:Fe-S-cluster containining protein